MRVERNYRLYFYNSKNYYCRKVYFNYNYVRLDLGKILHD